MIINNLHHNFIDSIHVGVAVYILYISIDYCIFVNITVSLLKFKIFCHI